MPPLTHHRERLADQIRDELALMVDSELEDPRIGLATVTRVELSPDLRHARVWVSVLGDEAAREQSLQGLTSAARYVRRELALRMRLRRAPEIFFALGRSAEEARKIEGLIEGLKRQENAAE